MRDNTLKTRILNEMVIDENTLSLIKDIYGELPKELQTIKNFEFIEKWAKIFYGEAKLSRFKENEEH